MGKFKYICRIPITFYVSKILRNFILFGPLNNEDKWLTLQFVKIFLSERECWSKYLGLDGPFKTNVSEFEYNLKYV